MMNNYESIKSNQFNEKNQNNNSISINNLSSNTNLSNKLNNKSMSLNQPIQSQKQQPLIKVNSSILEDFDKPHLSDSLLDHLPNEKIDDENEGHISSFYSPPIIKSNDAKSNITSIKSNLEVDSINLNVTATVIKPQQHNKSSTNLNNNISNSTFSNNQINQNNFIKLLFIYDFVNLT